MSYKNIKKTKLISLIFLSNIIKNHKKRAGEIPTMTLFFKKKPLVAVNFTIYELLLYTFFFSCPLYIL